MTTETTGRTLGILLLLLGLAACGKTPDFEQPQQDASHRPAQEKNRTHGSEANTLLPGVTVLRDGEGWLVRVELAQADRIRSLRVISGDFDEKRKGKALSGLLLFRLPAGRSSLSVEVQDQEGSTHRRKLDLP